MSSTSATVGEPDFSLLQSFGVAGLPGAFYVHSLLEGDQETDLFEHCQALCKTQGRKKGFISGLSGPRVAALRPAEYTAPLQAVIDKLKQRFGFFAAASPQQISVNSYSGQEAMVPHKDGTGDIGIIVSCGTPTLLDFWHKPKAAAVEKTEVFLKSNYIRDEDPESDQPHAITDAQKAVSHHIWQTMLHIANEQARKFVVKKEDPATTVDNPFLFIGLREELQLLAEHCVLKNKVTERERERII